MSVDILLIRDKLRPMPKAWFNTALRPREPEGWLGRTAQDGHLDSRTQLLNYEREVDVLGTPTLIVRTVSVDVKQH